MPILKVQAHHHLLPELTDLATKHREAETGYLGRVQLVGVIFSTDGYARFIARRESIGVPGLRYALPPCRRAFPCRVA